MCVPLKCKTILCRPLSCATVHHTIDIIRQWLKDPFFVNIQVVKIFIQSWCFRSTDWLWIVILFDWLIFAQITHFSHCNNDEVKTFKVSAKKPFTPVLPNLKSRIVFGPYRKIYQFHILLVYMEVLQTSNHRKRCVFRLSGKIVQNLPDKINRRRSFSRISIDFRMLFCVIYVLSGSSVS